jgi:hypothetical protein
MRGKSLWLLFCTSSLITRVCVCAGAIRRGSEPCRGKLIRSQARREVILHQKRKARYLLECHIILTRLNTQIKSSMIEISHYSRHLRMVIFTHIDQLLFGGAAGSMPKKSSTASGSTGASDEVDKISPDRYRQPPLGGDRCTTLHFLNSNEFIINNQ